MDGKASENAVFVSAPSRKAVLPFAFGAALLLIAFAVFGLWQAGAALGTAFLAYGFFRVKGASVTLTEENIKCGSAVIPIGEIDGAVCETGVFGKILGCGTLIIYTKGKTRTFKYLTRAEELRDKIMTAVDLHRFREVCREAKQARELMEKGGRQS